MQLTSGQGSGSFLLGSSAWRLNQYAAATAPATVSIIGILHVGPLHVICLQAQTTQISQEVVPQSSTCVQQGCLQLAHR
jgi:hypothetical protein